MQNTKYKHIELFKTIDEMYPNGIIGGFKQKNIKLYNKCKAIAKAESKTLKEFFNENGYEYFRVDIKEMYKKDAEALMALYPNKYVVDLHKNDSKLYFKILNHSKIEFNSLEEFIVHLGFTYDKYASEESLKDIFTKLDNLFPDRKIEKLSMKNQVLYSRIYKIARKEDLSVTEFLSKKGYKIDA